MTKDEALKLALEALKQIDEAMPFPVAKLAQAAIKEALAQPEQCQCPNCKVTLHASDCAVHSGPAYPAGGCDCGAQQEPEFFTHCVDQPYDWSEWVCPDPKSYLFKCCDCGLVHEAEFGVVRYKSDTDREDCDMVDDPNLQAVFRMRRSEQWSPSDMAHRAGGLTMEQPAQQYNATSDHRLMEMPAQQEPDRVKFERHWRKTQGEKKANRELLRHPLQPQTYIQDSANRHWVTWQAAVMSVATPAQEIVCSTGLCHYRKPLTNMQRQVIRLRWQGRNWSLGDIIDAVEAAHGIKGDA